ncbi:MAG: VCBS repeat-containing protein [Acidobacteria bacterium]|nr:VCBS repeat-containing protein [Acidobacteriota bacterium]
MKKLFAITLLTILSTCLNFYYLGGGKMFMKKNTKNLRSLFSVFAVLGLVITALWWGANTSTINAQAVRGTLFDFTGTGRTSFTVLTIPPAGSTDNVIWKVAGNPASPVPNQAFIRYIAYGFGTDVIVPQDYTGDRKTELAVWRPGVPGVFYISQFPTGTGGVMLDRAVPFGNTGYDPNAVGDYDGDRKIDYAVARVNFGILTYYIMSSNTNTMRQISFGIRPGADIFFVVNGADFTGDGRDEIVYFTVDANDLTTYNTFDAVTGAGVSEVNFGNFVTDYAFTPADYTGDGRADFVAARAGAGNTIIWYILNPVTNTVTATQFGIGDPDFLANDRPLRGDYDGDGRHDIAVYRRSNQTFYYISSQNGSLQGQKFGDPGDIPLGRFGTF